MLRGSGPIYCSLSSFIRGHPFPHSVCKRHLTLGLLLQFIFSQLVFLRHVHVSRVHLVPALLSPEASAWDDCLAADLFTLPLMVGLMVQAEESCGWSSMLLLIICCPIVTGKCFLAHARDSSRIHTCA